MLSRPPVRYPRFACVTPAWDNSARRRNGGAMILHDSIPSAYGHWLRSVLVYRQTLTQLPAPFVFINAWNECAEGNYLKPDMRDSHEYLEMIREIIELPHEPA